jgi:hypothetical protein
MKDNLGNNLEVVTDFALSDYKHSCRSCKEMTDEKIISVT